MKTYASFLTVHQYFPNYLPHAQVLKTTSVLSASEFCSFIPSTQLGSRSICPYVYALFHSYAVPHIYPCCPTWQYFHFGGWTAFSFVHCTILHFSIQTLLNISDDSISWLLWIQQQWPLKNRYLCDRMIFFYFQYVEVVPSSPTTRRQVMTGGAGFLPPTWGPHLISRLLHFCLP